MRQHVRAVYNQHGERVPLRKGMIVRQGWTAQRGGDFEQVEASGFLLPVYDYVDDMTSRKEIVGWEIEAKKFD